MRNFKDDFKPMPERFLYGIEESIAEAQTSVKVKRRRVPVKLIAIIAALAVAIPIGVFAAGQISGMKFTEVGNYAVKFELDASSVKASPKYIKFKATPPEGFKKIGELSYMSEETNKILSEIDTAESDEDYEEWEKKFENAEFGYVGFILARPDLSKEDEDDILKNITNREERVINGRAVLFFDDAGHAITEGKSIYKCAVYFDCDVNILVACFFTNDIDRETAAEFIANSSVTEGTKSDHTDFADRADYAEDENPSENDLDDWGVTYDVKAAGEEFEGTFKNDVTVSADNFRYLDNVSTLKDDDISFEFTGFEYSDVINSDGNFIPQKRQMWNYGDGINTIDKLEKEEDINQRLLLVDVTYTNKGKKQKTFEMGEDSYVGYLDSTKGKLTDHDEYPSVEGIVYIKDWKQNARFKLKPSESRTVTLGWVIDENMTDKTYLIFQNFADISDGEATITFKAVKADG